MEQFLLDFIDNIGNVNFSFVTKFLLVCLILFWLVVLYWVWLDVSERTTNPYTRILSVVLVLVLNVVGLVIYLLVRPSQTIEEIYWADLERRYLKYETVELGDCPKCGSQLYPGFKFCPECKYKLKIKCTSCGIHVQRDCKYCPNCGEELRKRHSYAPESAPSVEVMEEQIEASKEKAVQVVESKQVRYSTSKSIAVIIGDFFLNMFSKKEKPEISVNESNNSKKEYKKVERKERKKKNRKKKNR